jgi:hypothetical protein
MTIPDAQGAESPEGNTGLPAREVGEGRLDPAGYTTLARRKRTTQEPGRPAFHSPDQIIAKLRYYPAKAGTETSTKRIKHSPDQIIAKPRKADELQGALTLVDHVPETADMAKGRPAHHRAGPRPDWPGNRVRSIHALGRHSEVVVVCPANAAGDGSAPCRQSK